MDFGAMKDKAGALIGEHGDQIDEGLDRAGEFAKDHVGGYGEQIDQAVDRAKDMTGGGDESAEQPSGEGDGESTGYERGQQSEFGGR